MVSVLTLVHGRPRHLDNVLAGLENSAVKPDEVIVVHMNEKAQPRKSRCFPIVSLEVSGEGTLPLAAARNIAASSATYPERIFLDVDCIPNAELVGRYVKAMRDAPGALYQGEVRYLPAHVDASTATVAHLQSVACEHPLHAFRTGGGEMPYALFWSLNFACTKTVFDKIGGFDLRYRGYGGEDTDFSYRARQQGVALVSSPALAFHQYHRTYDPPLNHLVDIVNNAEVFRRIWGVWPMRGWLDAFEERGYIRMLSEHVERIRLPSDHEIAACMNQTRNGF
ncbi:hypothetical protein WM40_20715 [Robbsia andropogonis]|uniref:Galactosyltransferase C-terminal domain-containing protein n=2 Tax=Robbsia andropogonis TaxID=28092 RepID=A0A0F5JW07_9BURK|nr:galactosyltransferase-related protein [Robbsia andropogonis]KKB61834.1 hypothetical protein WM40_20715 [Robbsia andropogonis]MCP1118619.1 galactosyltransferase-related protein [Robbsia andropogonis]MCP1128086.1 galactosyltransferase-related protein [Robbsia andropogonis]